MNTSGIKILVVDDENVVCSNVIAFLEDEGFTVFSATSGEEALSLLHSKDVDVGIIDMRLPGIDGNTFIMRAHEMKPIMKFLIHTGSTNYSLPSTLVDLGISPNQVFRKPLLDMGQLVSAIHRLIGEGVP
jgi:DNA-binding NtrC family response regulator